MTKRYTNDASHSRFHVFRHKTVDGVQTMEHYSDTWGWVVKFSESQLFINEEDAVEFAKKMAGGEGFSYCVGKVFVEVDGHYQMQVF